MTRNIVIALVVALCFSGIFILQIMLGQADSIYGVWDLGEQVDVELREDNTFFFYVKVGQIDQQSLTGTFSFDQETKQINFQRNDEAFFSWNDVSAEENRLSFTLNGTPQIISRVGTSIERQNSITKGDAVLAVFPFNRRLAEELSEGYDMATRWNALKGFRNSHESFQGAVLYEDSKGDALYPYITVDQWSNAVAYESFASIFKTDAVEKASYITEENGPGVYQAIERLGSMPTRGEHVYALILINVPDNLIETYLSQWKILSDFMANQNGFDGAELHRKVDGADNHYEYFIRAAWKSEDAFDEARNSDFYQAIITNEVYTVRSALYRIAAEDRDGMN